MTHNDLGFPTVATSRRAQSETIEAIITESPDPISGEEIAARLGIDRRTVSRITLRLVEQGRVHRSGKVGRSWLFTSAPASASSHTEAVGAAVSRGASTNQQICQALGLTPRQVTRALSALVARGEVERGPRVGREWTFRSHVVALPKSRCLHDGIPAIPAIPDIGKITEDAGIFSSLRTSGIFSTTTGATTELRNGAGESGLRPQKTGEAIDWERVKEPIFEPRLAWKRGRFDGWCSICGKEARPVGHRQIFLLPAVPNQSSANMICTYCCLDGYYGADPKAQALLQERGLHQMEWQSRCYSTWRNALASSGSM